jgi:thiol-disulfide isomerase/thioredoxin
MRTLVPILTCLATVWTASAAAVPRPSPDFVLQRGSEPTMHLSHFRGKIVALVFGQTMCEHCQDLTRILKVIQKDYAARNVQVVECLFGPDVEKNYAPFLKALQPNFTTGYLDYVVVKKYLQWEESRNGSLMVPYMIFIDAGGVIRGDFSGKDGFFVEGDKNIRAQLDKMTKAAKAAKK